MDSNHYRAVVYALSYSAIREVIVLFSFFNIVLDFVKLNEHSATVSIRTKLILDIYKLMNY